MSTCVKIWLIVAISLLILGIAMFCVAMSLIKWDFNRLTTHEFETATYEISDEISDISITVDVVDVSFLKSDTDTCKVVCYEYTKQKHDVTVEDGKLTICENDTRKWYDYIGIFSSGNPMITVYLPEEAYGVLDIVTDTGDVGIPSDFSFESINVKQDTGDINCHASVSGVINIEKSTGDIELGDISAGEISLKTSTGDMNLRAISCDGNLSINVSSGKVEMESVSCKSFSSSGSTGSIEMTGLIASESISIERSTGDVEFEACDASEITVKTDTGDVEGSFLSEKIFVTHTSTGDVRVPSSTSGGICTITTDTGDIEIYIKN